ncbi:MAG: hypothetical protein F4110_15390 [Acidimicrobiaceae bacterium]|nr:hypothetical protein [Acidimicrobiaceae bacterium]MXZ97542.1 hypothetical protein [Acidimicrobiaceae bacterium]MYE74848.1 hypothetical protein [Acidimicrobiaceae bacterium]MYE96659.1 hypothetical protein [Acidimicrobiaceae bacterium]MYH42440.1 hypothetical protein [Acidimicrobiaceae bacterium]
MNAISLSQLGPIIAAIMGPMLAFVVASMRFQHLEAVRTREPIADSERETRELITNSERGIRGEPADVRERSARIEGRLGIAAPPPQDETGEAGESGPEAA